MKTFPELSEKGKQETLHVIERWREAFRKAAEEEMEKLYVNVLPHIETDSWQNYRNELKSELEHEYRHSKFKDQWAVNFRRVVFIEHREELAKLIEHDIMKRIKTLEDRHQEYECFRYTPLGDTYQCLKKENEEMKKRLEKLGEP